MCFSSTAGECIPERDAAAAPPLSQHPDLAGGVLPQRCAPGGASWSWEDRVGPQGGHGGGSQPGGGQRTRGRSCYAHFHF